MPNQKVLKQGENEYNRHPYITYTHPLQFHNLRGKAVLCDVYRCMCGEGEEVYVASRVMHTPCSRYACK